MLMQRIPDVHYDAVAHPVHKIVLQISGNGFQEIDRNNRQ